MRSCIYATMRILFLSLVVICIMIFYLIIINIYDHIAIVVLSDLYYKNIYYFLRMQYIVQLLYYILFLI